MNTTPKHIDFNHVTDLITYAHNRVFKTINKELVLLYREIGSYVSNKVNSGDWGDGFVVHETSVFERTMLSETIESPAVTQLQKNVSKVFKDSYVFEFLDLPSNYTLRRNISPALVTEYETKLINKKLLQQTLHDLYLIFEKKEELEND